MSKSLIFRQKKKKKKLLQQLVAYCLLFIVTKGPPQAEGDDTKENVFSQGPPGKPPRHYAMLARSTRSRYTRNIWPEPLMGYLWDYMLLKRRG